MTTLAEATEVQPDELVTEKLYVPVTKPEIVVLVVDPVMVPGLMTQFPAGSPVNSTLPVATVHVGCVIVPKVGGAGVIGCGFITTLADAAEVHPDEFVTVKLQVPVVSPEIVVDVPDPAILPGFIVQLPAGNPFNTTLPVGTVQVGCTNVSTIGAVGVPG